MVPIGHQASVLFLFAFHYNCLKFKSVPMLAYEMTPSTDRGSKAESLQSQSSSQLWIFSGNANCNSPFPPILDRAAGVFGVEIVTYNGEKTYDLLPASDTGFYWADGVLLGSTLFRAEK